MECAAFEARPCSASAQVLRNEPGHWGSALHILDCEHTIWVGDLNYRLQGLAAPDVLAAIQAGGVGRQGRVDASKAGRARGTPLPQGCVLPLLSLCHAAPTLRLLLLLCRRAGVAAGCGPAAAGDAGAAGLPRLAGAGHRLPAHLQAQARYRAVPGWVQLAANLFTFLSVGFCHLRLLV